MVAPGEVEARAKARGEELAALEARLASGRRLRLSRQYGAAAAELSGVLGVGAPETIERSAVLELALVAQEEGNLARVLQILAQYLTRWPQDAIVPELLLRQGLIYRQLGVYELALTKFYATMTSALGFKDGHLDYYRKLVLQSQVEIAETLMAQGRPGEAEKAFARLLKEESGALNRARVHYRYICCLQAQGKFAEVAGQAQEFLTRCGEAEEQAEVRFLRAGALKRLGRNGEALGEVLRLLESQQGAGKNDPGMLAYWQQRTGNEIANQMYQEGDYLHALEVYLAIVPLSPTAAWQLPALYQVGLVYERLEQPAKAIEAFAGIVGRAGEVATNGTPGLQLVVDMARWRRDFLDWRGRAETTHRELKAGVGPEPAAAPTPQTSTGSKDESNRTNSGPG
jgi:tetratricopeptide (TPR) repeat protein